MAAAMAALHQVSGQSCRSFAPPKCDVVSPWAQAPEVCASPAGRGLTRGEAVLLRPRPSHEREPPRREAKSGQLQPQPDVRRAETAPELNGQASSPSSASALKEVIFQGGAGDPYGQQRCSTASTAASTRHSHEGRCSLDAQERQSILDALGGQERQYILDAFEGRRSLDALEGRKCLEQLRAVGMRGAPGAATAPEHAPGAKDRIRASGAFLHALKTVETVETVELKTVETVETVEVSAPAPRAVSATDQENAYLRRNIEHLRKGKRFLEGQVVSLKSQAGNLDQQNKMYKDLYEQSKACMMLGNGGAMEISNLHQQLTAVLMLKDVLNTENIELQRRLQAAETEAGNESKHTACVICMDNLANVVCLPCKHLALCTFCSQQDGLSSCPICRSDIGERLQIYMP